MASIEPWETLEHDAARIFEAERHRVEKVLALAPEPARTGFAAHLVLAADQFITRPGTRPEEQMLAQNPDWQEELRRPMMLIISSTKKEKASA